MASAAGLLPVALKRFNDGVGLTADTLDVQLSPDEGLFGTSHTTYRTVSSLVARSLSARE